MRRKRRNVRIRHHTRRNQATVVPLLDRPLTQPRHCKTCGTAHLSETIHLTLDDYGAAIVPVHVWRQIERSPKSGGFSLVNVVAKKPPTQVLRPELTKIRVEAFDLDDGVNPVHQISIDEAVKTIMAMHPDADESHVLTYLLSKVLAEGPETTGR